MISGLPRCMLFLLAVPRARGQIEDEVLIRPTGAHVPAAELGAAEQVQAQVDGPATHLGGLPPRATRGARYCINRGRLIFCAGGSGKTLPGKGQGMVFTVRVKDPELAERLRTGDFRVDGGSGALWRPAAAGPFDASGARRTTVGLPRLGRSATWQLAERSLQRGCGDGTLLWPMNVVLANYVGGAPEFPRLRILELGSGTGLAALALASRGHTVLATDGDACVLGNLRSNVQDHPITGPGAVQVLQLRWDVERDRAAAAAYGAFDVVVGADLLRKRAACDPVRATLQRMLSAGAEAVLAEVGGRPGGPAASCFSAMRQAGWHVEDVEAKAEQLLDAEIEGNRSASRWATDGLAPLVMRIRLV